MQPGPTPVSARVPMCPRSVLPGGLCASFQSTGNGPHSCLAGPGLHPDEHGAGPRSDSWSFSRWKDFRAFFQKVTAHTVWGHFLISYCWGPSTTLRLGDLLEGLKGFSTQPAQGCESLRGRVQSQQQGEEVGRPVQGKPGARSHSLLLGSQQDVTVTIRVNCPPAETHCSGILVDAGQVGTCCLACTKLRTSSTKARAQHVLSMSHTVGTAVPYSEPPSSAGVVGAEPRFLDQPRAKLASSLSENSFKPAALTVLCTCVKHLKLQVPTTRSICGREK